MASLDILQRICLRRREDVAAAKAAMPAASLRARFSAHFPNDPASLLLLLRDHPTLAVAAEFKRASPSKGQLAGAETSVKEHAEAYTRGGAAVLSILTEPNFFGGSLQDLEDARRASEAAAADLQQPAL